MANTPAFSAAYSQLNPDQRRAVDQLDGPVMVIAGPGTGKTQVMAVRIGKILQTTDTSPRAILALTFTDAATKNLRQRLVDLIGTTGYQVPIHTFHSFCSAVIQDCPEYFPFNKDSQALTELEKYQILTDILATHPLEALKPLNAPDLYLRNLNSAISDLKREGVTPDDLEKMVSAEATLLDESATELGKTELSRRTKRLQKQQELVIVYREYQAALSQRSQYDFEDMISSVKIAFTNESDLLAEYQERFLYLLVDEYQDTNNAQNAVVQLLASFWGEDANLFVVGDPHQSIYRFQGASVENMLEFTRTYPQATAVTLSIGYRCPQEIYDAAATLISHNPTPQLRASDQEVQNRLAALWQAATQPLEATHQQSSSLLKVELPAQTNEYQYVVERIKALLATGVEPAEIAVLYRHNQDSSGLMPVLEQAGISFAIDGGIDILKVPAVQQWQTVLEVVLLWQQGIADQRLYQVLQQPWWELSPVILMKVARAAHKAKQDWWTVLTANEEQLIKWEPQLTPLELQPLLAITTNFQRWASSLLTTPLSAWLRMVMSESGFLDWVSTQPNRLELLSATNTWLTQVEAWCSLDSSLSLSAALASLNLMMERKIGIAVESTSSGESAVTLATVHKAKGREWKYVFLLHVVDGKWGHNFSRELLPLPEGILQLTQTSDHEGLEDERRLFYVALTRAKEKVFVCVPQTMLSETKNKEVVISQFATEIAEHVQPEDHPAAETARHQDAQELLSLIKPLPPTRWADRERAYLQGIAQTFKLSVSALNKYLESPQDFVDQYLLKIPTMVEPQLAFGSAIHRALEVWEKKWMTQGAQPDLALLESTFIETLSAEPLDQSEMERRLSYGKQVLATFITYLQQTTKPPLFVEKFFGQGWSQAVLGDIQLTGRIDRIDWLDESAKTATVIDYKTGRSKTPGQIYATDKATFAELSPRERELPETIRGRHQRQLVFYKLLTDLDPTFKLNVTHGTFVFVEPDKESGKMVTRSMELSDQAVVDLKSLIQEVVAEIRTLTFLENQA